VGAIHKVDKKLTEIDMDECVECGNCLRCADCPTDALYQQELTYPRTVRSLMSDVLTVAEESKISGRGTEEMKTNEVTGRFKPGQVGIAIEVGRPCLGTRIYDVEKIAKGVATLGIEFEKANPVTSMMSDPATGAFKAELLNEKVLSAILEFCVTLDQLPQLFNVLAEVSQQIDTIFSLDMATKLAADGGNPTQDFLESSGIWRAPNGKTNVGLGRPLLREDR
jgi:hypothetical protein